MNGNNGEESKKRSRRNEKSVRVKRSKSLPQLKIALEAAMCPAVQAIWQLIAVDAPSLQKRTILDETQQSQTENRETIRFEIEWIKTKQRTC